MSILPTWPIAAGTLVIGLVAGAAGMSWWDADEIADRDVTIARMKADQAAAISAQYKQAADDLAGAAKTIKAAAETGSTDVSALNAKLDTINRSIKNAKPAPLPADCHPGADRVRNLSESAAAVDQAIARPVSGK